VSRLPGTAVFVLATLVLLVGAVLMGWRGVQLRDPLRLAFAVILLGFSGALAYETFAYATGLDPTISLITATEFARHPAVWLAFFLPAMLLAGALAMHFVSLGGTFRWWVVAVGGAAYAAGAVVTWRTGWLP
jgi:hypothetical protein